MKTYIALLRGINVSGHKKVPMADLRSMLQKMGFKDISTYIQSGNVVFSSDEKDSQTLEEQIKKRIQDTFGFEVPVLVKSVAEFKKMIQQNPFTEAENLEKNQVYFVLLRDIPLKEKVAIFQKEEFKNEKFEFTTDCVYLLCQDGYGRAKLNNNLVERKLKVEATTRNYRTMAKLLEMAEK